MKAQKLLLSAITTSTLAMALLTSAGTAMAEDVVLDDNDNVLRVTDLEINMDDDTLDGLYNVEFVTDIGSNIYGSPPTRDFPFAEDHVVAMGQLLDALNRATTVPVGAGSVGSDFFYILGIEFDFPVPPVTVWAAPGGQIIFGTWGRCEERFECIAGISVLRPEDTNTFAKFTKVGGGGGEGTFNDVPPTYWAFIEIEAVAAAGISGGCDADNYCPSDFVTRASMAVFLERAMRGGDFVPPAPQGVFADVPTDYWAAAFIEQLAADGITAGCDAGNFCPDDIITRAQMAVFLEKAKEWPTPFVPPPATGTVFLDVPVDHWAGAWIEEVAADGITSGCGGENYCPEDLLTRDAMAVFLTRAFGL